MGDTIVQGVSPTVAQQQDEASPFKKIVGINFLIFLGYYVLILFSLKFNSPIGSRWQLSNLYLVLYPVQGVLNLLLGGICFFIDTKKAVAFAFSGLLILVVGFGGCFIALTGGFVRF